MKSGSTKYSELPTATRRIFDLVESKTDGNVRKFAELIGVKQQSFNRLFNPDPRSGKYPTVSSDIMQAIISTFGVDEAWFYQGNTHSESGRQHSINSSDADKILDIWMRFMENQRQGNEIMREMAELYKQIKGE